MPPYKTPPIATPFVFDIHDVPAMEYQIDDKLKMVIAPISAAELVQLEGITNGELFTQNVRYWLGKNTPVNKAITDSIKNTDEHKYFPAFHNGLIILCEKLEHDPDNKKITISKYSVVNGCQSLSGLYDNKDSITPVLKILTKFFELPEGHDLGTTITNRTNNQNGSKPRDSQSNSDIQTRLQTAIKTKYGDELFYRISRGESPEDKSQKIIENELAGQMLVSFDLKRPHDTYLNLFESERHKEIFSRPQVNADRIIALYDLLRIGDSVRAEMSNRRFANYPRTKFFLLLMVKQALELDAAGKRFIDNPTEFLKQENGRERLRYCFNRLVKTLGDILDGEVSRREEEEGSFDYKSELKKPELVRKMSSLLLTQYKVFIRNSKFDKPFSDLWQESEDEIKAAKA